MSKEKKEKRNHPIHLLVQKSLNRRRKALKLTWYEALVGGIENGERAAQPVESAKG